jgi:hypothetical protein
MTVSETPGRTTGPGLLLAESANSGILPPGAISSAVTVTFWPSLNIGSRGGVTDAAGAAGVWIGGPTAGAVGVTTAAVGEVAGDKETEASPLGLGGACGVGAGDGTGAGANGFGFVATGGGVLSPR